MGILFYNIFLILFRIGVSIASLSNPKAKKWVQGRRHIFKKLKSAVTGNTPVIWIHCASLGEFEQGRPLIEKLRTDYPEYKLLLTFFSPSGYEIRKNYDKVDWVFYLPMDGAKKAKLFLDIINPSLVIFIKYEFWHYYLKKIKYRKIPLLLVSALFRKEMSFFKWYGAFQRKMLSRFNHLFVQNEDSKELMNKIGLANITSISGDTRFDRVIEIAEKAEPISTIESFIKNDKTIIAGSTWPEDEKILKEIITTINEPHLKIIIAPHEINKKHLTEIKQNFPTAILFSEFVNEQQPLSSNILIIDNIGLLSRLYKYAFITYVGGGFNSGIHNILEAAVYGKPVLFGPKFYKSKEAADLINGGGAMSITKAEDCAAVIQNLLSDKEAYINCCKSSEKYVHENKGATEKVVSYIQEKRLLIN